MNEKDWGRFTVSHLHIDAQAEPLPPRDSHPVGKCSSLLEDSMLVVKESICRAKILSAKVVDQMLRGAKVNQSSKQTLLFLWE